MSCLEKNVTVLCESEANKCNIQNWNYTNHIDFYRRIFRKCRYNYIDFGEQNIFSSKN